MGFGMKDQFVQILKQLNLKVTSRRLEVMICLAIQHSYLSAEEVWALVRPKLGRIGQPTVYRILNELAEAGVITRIFMSDRKQNFFLCSNLEHHHHFVCESCRRVVDIDYCRIDEIEGDIALHCDGEITSYIFQINGICGACCKLKKR